jgi:hypothetical protein
MEDRNKIANKKCSGIYQGYPPYDWLLNPEPCAACSTTTPRHQYSGPGKKVINIKQNGRNGQLSFDFHLSVEKSPESSPTIEFNLVHSVQVPPVKMSTQSLQDLALQISSLTYTCSRFLKNAGAAAGDDGDVLFPKALEVPEDVQAAKEQLMQAAQSLHDLVVGPEDRLRRMAIEVCGSIKPKGA